MSPLHSSTRRPAPLKYSDFDHEIILVDHTLPTPVRTRSPSQEDIERQVSSGLVSDSSSRRHSDVPLRKHASKKLHQQLTRTKYGKYKGQPVGAGDASYDEEDTSAADTDGHATRDIDEGGRPSMVPTRQHDQESAIDILFENQRGGFLCGIPLFSSNALGNLDPSSWTNSALKTSATNITNAQVPDPSWEWIWKEWSVNHTDEVDEDGWEYSFAFSKHFSWHGPSWWNSFVRRRAWLRKRARKQAQPQVQEAHMLNSDYFTIHPVVERSNSRASAADGTIRKRYSVDQLAKQEMEREDVLEDIKDISTLMATLKHARIDREKLEAVESFIMHGGEELYYLRDKMHDIMRFFVFQASRKLLLRHLLHTLDEATQQQKEDAESEEKPDLAKVRRLDNLVAAVKHADEEVQRLEFWSDVKDIAERGETKGAVDPHQGWDETWAGIDRSGLEDVISKRKFVGDENCNKSEKRDIADSPRICRKENAKDARSRNTALEENSTTKDTALNSSKKGKGKEVCLEH